jgi:hypothetical protein
MKRKFLTCLLIIICLYATTHAQGIVITAGGNLVMNGAPNMVVNNGSITNSGVFIPSSSTVVLTGTATSASSFIAGTATTSFYNLNINKSAGSFKLLRNIAITNNLMMLAGNYDLNGFDTDLGSTGSISGESAGSYIMGASGGTINRTINLNAPTAMNPGNIGIEITSTANLGLTTIKRGEQQQVSGSGFSINRYYDILPANNTALNASLKMYYFDAELATINENELKFWSLNPAAGNIWKLLGADAQDATANYVTKNNIDQLYRFTLASSVSNPLPVQLIAFNAQLSGGQSLIKWATSHELNNHHFELEKSADGSSFSLLGSIVAVGNSNIASNYSYTDANPFAGITYYRLKQVNADGSYTYSKVVAVNKGAYTNKLVNAYPNPTSGPVEIRFTSAAAASAIVQVTDAKGLLVISKTMSVSQGLNSTTIHLGRFAQGTYYLRVVGIDNKVLTILKN